MVTMTAAPPPTDLCRVIERDGILMQLADGELSGMLAEQYLRHIKTCPTCVTLAADLLFLDALIKDRVLQGIQETALGLTVNGHVDLGASDPFAAAATGRGCLVSSLTTGERLTADVFDRTGALLLMEGTLVSANIVDALRTRGIDLIYLGTPPSPAELVTEAAALAAASAIPAAPVVAPPAATIIEVATPVVETVAANPEPLAIQEDQGHPRVYLQDTGRKSDAPKLESVATYARLADEAGKDISFIMDTPGPALVDEIPVEIPEGYFFGTRGTPRKFHPNDYRDLLFVAQAEPALSQATKLRAYTQLERSLTDLKEAGVADLTAVRQTSEQVITELLKDERKTCSLADLFLVSSQVFSHCFNTLVTFVSLGKALDLTADALTAAGECVLFHDIGRILPIEDGDDAAGAYRRHPQRGYEHLLDQGGFDVRYLDMVRDHHERVDGRGFSRGLAGAAIPLATQVLILANTYDTLCTDPVHGVKRSFHRAAQALVQSGGQLVSPEITRSFLKVFGMYPPGTIVQLKSRELAVVREATYGRPFQPQVTLLRDAVGQEYATPLHLDLSEHAVPIERAMDVEAVLAY